MGMLNFDKNRVQETTKSTDSDDFIARIVKLDIDEVEVSHLNPRIIKGENYESTKESIKNIGIQQMVTVARPPDSDKYCPFNGGNTRVTIIKELLQEYLDAGDTENAEKIRYQDFKIVPYTDDLDSLIKHMGENEDRSKMVLIEKAKAIFKIKELYLEMNGFEDVSNRELVKIARKRGWTTLNHQVMTELTFAYDKLIEVIPLALNAGAGKAKINQIRTWLSTYLKYADWLRQKGIKVSDDETEMLYLNKLAEFDDDLDPVDLKSFYEVFISEFSRTLRATNEEFTTNRVQLDIDLLTEHGEIPEERPWAELSDELQQTATTPPAKFPTPRKPRTVNPKTNNDDSETGGENNNSNEANNELDNQLPEITKNVSAQAQPTNLDTYRSITVQIIENLLAQHKIEHLRQYILTLSDFNEESNELDILKNSLLTKPPFVILNLIDNQPQKLLNLLQFSAEELQISKTQHFVQSHLILHLMYITRIHINHLVNGVRENDLLMKLKQSIDPIWGVTGTKYFDFIGYAESGIAYKELTILEESGSDANRLKAVESHTELFELLKQHLNMISEAEQTLWTDINSEVKDDEQYE